MIAQVKCRIDSATRDKDHVVLEVSSVSGKVDTKMPPAQFIEFKGTIRIKPIIGDTIRIGSVLVIDIEDKEDEGA